MCVQIYKYNEKMCEIIYVFLCQILVLNPLRILFTCLMSSYTVFTASVYYQTVSSVCIVLIN